MSFVCRVCLSSDLRLRTVTRTELMIVYNRLTNNEVGSADTRSRAVCCYCYQILLKCNTFSKMAQRSEKIFNKLFSSGLLKIHGIVPVLKFSNKLQWSTSPVQFMSIEDYSEQNCHVSVKEEPVPANHESTVQEEIQDFKSVCSNSLVEEDIERALSYNTDQGTAKPHEQQELSHVENQATESNAIFQCDGSSENYSTDKKHMENNHTTVSVEHCRNTNAKKDFDKMHKGITQKIHGSVPVLKFSNKLKWTKTPFRFVSVEDKSKQNCHVSVEEEPVSAKYESTVKEKIPDLKSVCSNSSVEEDIERALSVNIDKKTAIPHEQQELSYVENQGTESNAIFQSDGSSENYSTDKKHIENNHTTVPAELKKHCRNTNANVDFDKTLKGTSTTQKVCSVCDKFFNKKSQLITHMKRHTGKKPFTCTVCDKSFNAKYDLTVHKKTHIEEKPFICALCDTAFSLQSSLREHIRTHTGEKPYACSVCEKSFSQILGLIEHQKQHIGEKTLKCSVCDKTYSNNIDLRTHERSHNVEKPIVCSICGKTFSRKSSLKNHVRILHSGEKPYACPVCGKSFSHTGKFMNHKMSHIGEIPYNRLQSRFYK